MARTVSTFSASSASTRLRSTASAPVLSPAARSAYALTRPLVMPGDVFQGAGTAGYTEGDGIERVQRDPRAMQQAEQQAGGMFTQVPGWAWALGAAGAVYLLMRWRGGSKPAGQYAVG